jgi:DNA repair photolyase
LNIREIKTKNALTKTGIPGYDYCLNPYVGCAHACTYCYATFMKRFTGHPEPWGSFVDVKINAADALLRQVRRIRSGCLVVGSVTDPYQPVERKYGVTRQCLTILARTDLTVHILTRSDLIVRDIDILKQIPDLEAGLSITTDNDDIRKIFEPNAPPIESRLEALKVLHDAGIRTYIFAGPLLPLDPKKFASMISGLTDEVLIDKLNYSYKVEKLIRSKGLGPQMSLHMSRENARILAAILRRSGIEVSILFE